MCLLSARRLPEPCETPRPSAPRQPPLPLFFSPRHAFFSPPLQPCALLQAPRLAFSMLPLELICPYRLQLAWFSALAQPAAVAPSSDSHQSLFSELDPMQPLGFQLAPVPS